MDVNKIKAIIIDDEQASRQTLENYLGKYCADVEILALAESVKTGIEAIEKHQPNLIFLDVEMPYGNAFDLLEQVQEINFETIFVTAFSHYALKALNFSAAYYILKPIDIDELILAVDKVKKDLKAKSVVNHTRILIDNLQDIKKQNHKIVLPVLDGFEVVQVKDIIRCQGNSNFTDFHLLNGKKKVICRVLKHFEAILKDYGFMRVHKSHLVNLQHIQSYHKGSGGSLTMIDQSEVEVSINKKQELLQKFA